MRLAIKYPLKQEVIPINGRDSGRILSAGTARMSPKNRDAINSAPKNTVTTVAKAIIRVSSTERRIILAAPFLVPTASSSAMSRVTAVQIPLAAKVEASIYTLKTS